MRGLLPRSQFYLCIIGDWNPGFGGNGLGSLRRLKTKSIIESKANGGKRPYVCIKQPNKKENYQKGLLRGNILRRKFWTLVQKMANFSHLLDKNMERYGC
jgi:hypothetical protein